MTESELRLLRLELRVWFHEELLSQVLVQAMGHDPALGKSDRVLSLAYALGLVDIAEQKSVERYLADTSVAPAIRQQIVAVAREVAASVRARLQKTAA